MTKIIPEIPIKFEGKFPDTFQNTFPYWGFFSREEIEKDKGKLLMLDIDFGRYCSLKCHGCFRRDNTVDDTGNKDLSYDELIKVIDEAKEIGLQSVKICGVGEPTENTKLLEFVREMTQKDIGVAVFTKGQVLGSDEKSRHYNRKEGIDSAMDLCSAFYDLKVSFMLGFQSFDDEIQDRIYGVKGHTLVRNKALENLVEAGFTDTNLTRVAFCNAPFTKENYADTFEVYTYARRRNIFPVSAVLMTSGKQIDHDYLKKYDMSDKEKIDIWTKIYSWNIEQGIQTLEQIKEEGISVLPGGHPCNQVAVGLYVTANGNVIGCPGFTEVEGNVRDNNIQEIWEESQNRSLRAGKFNCRCPPKDGITMPIGLYDTVLEILEKKYV